MEMPDVRSRVVLTPAERQMMIEQCDTLALAANAYQQAVKDGRIHELLDRFYAMTEPHEYIGKILGQKVQMALVEALKEEVDG